MNYYYLISSLPDLELDNGKNYLSINEFISFCEEELKEEDFKELKKLFIFNDIKSAAFSKDKEFKVLSPSFYSDDEFRENLKDTDSFFPFLAEYFFYDKSDKKLQPKLLNIDEIILFFYEYINDFGNSFIKNYFMFELNLHNVTTALSLRANKITDPDKIIPYGDEASALIKSSSQDFGLSLLIDFMDKLTEVYKENNLIKIEKTIDQIRWDYLEESLGIEFFTVNYIFAYAVKLLSIERWNLLTDKKGDETLNGLIAQISDNVKFDEF